MDIKNVKTDTLIRTVLLVVALFNQLLTAFGKSPMPIDDKSITELISAAATIIVSVWAWWKNNSFTKAAIEADAYMEYLKEEETN